ncbi:MAG: hypothetical protein R6V85_19580 [Polyangia bacterium]
MKELLFAVTGLFFLMLVFRLVRSVVLGRRLSSAGSCEPDDSGDPELSRLVSEAADTPRAREILREIERRAGIAETPASRASHHCAAASIALQKLKRPSVAVKFYLRALRDDPTCREALAKLQEILIAQKRHRRLEWTCWDVLGRLDDEQIGSFAWRAAWRGLTAVYSASPRHVSRADAIRKMLAAVDTDDESEPDASASLPRAVP